MDIIKKIFGSSDEEKKEGNLKLQIRFSPIRLQSKKENQINMIVKVKNETHEAKLLSLVASFDKNVPLGFEPSIIAKTIEKRIGELKPGEEKEFTIPIYATLNTKAGEYEISLSLNVHYLKYESLLAEGIKRKLKIRVV